MTAPARRMTVPEFFAYAVAEEARGGPRRWELIDGRPEPLPREPLRHTFVRSAVAAALDRALRVVVPDGHVLCGASVVVDAATIYEPDVVAQYGAPIDFDAYTVDAPTIAVEVLSPSSVARDTITKLAGYFRVASIRHYLIVDPDTRIVVHHARREAGGPILTATHGPDERLTLDPPGLALEVAALFEGLPVAS